MSGLQELIEGLSERAADSDLLALLAATRERRLYNAALAETLRELVEALKREMDLRQAPVLVQSNEIRVAFEKNKLPKPANLPCDVQPTFASDVSSSIA